MGRLGAWAAAVMVAGALAAPRVDAARPPEAGSSERRMLDLVNAERSKRGRRRREWDQDLARLARLHAEDMRKAGRISHASRDGTTYEGRLARGGYRASAAAENVALDRDVEHAHEGLMQSPG